MQQVFEQAYEQLRNAASRDDLVTVIGKVAFAFGFRSAYAVEFDIEKSLIIDAIDTVPGRIKFFEEYHRTNMKRLHKPWQSYLNGPSLNELKPERLLHAHPDYQAFCERCDIASLWMVMITYSGQWVASVGFSGEPNHVTRSDKLALRMFSYNLIAHLRYLRTREERQYVETQALSRREREVLDLASQGMTSPQIAKQLSIAVRTANQHFENAALKLGTRNRAHTIAEAIRHQLLG
ncbi:MAG: helix-turn-helix transcriptional regulator [Cucumibacter sp.]